MAVVVVAQLSKASLKHLCKNRLRLTTNLINQLIDFKFISNRKLLARTFTCASAWGIFKNSYDYFREFLLQESRIFKVRSGSPERHDSFLRSRFVCAILSLIRVKS